MKMLKIQYIHFFLIIKIKALEDGLKFMVLRIKNMHGAFRSNLRGKNLPEKVLLVDDVMTTGATLDQAARACLAAGCTDVCAVTLAREP